MGHAHVRSIEESGGAILGERRLDLDALVVPTDIRSTWGLRYAQAVAEHKFVAGNPPPSVERRDVASPLTDEMLRPFRAAQGTIQFKSLLTDDDFRRLAAWLEHYPDVTLRAYGSYDDSIRDLEFLRFFPALRRFDADALYQTLESLDGLHHLREDLDALELGWTKRQLDVGIIGRFRDLRTLYLEGHTKGLEVVSGLTTLEDLTLRSITLPDLSLLLPLSRLLSLDIKLGGTHDVRLLPDIGALRYLELWHVKGLSDLSAVGQIASLRFLFLQAMRQVERLPDFSGALSLRRVHLETMKGVRDLSPLRTAPVLEEVELLDMNHLKADDLRPLVGLPNLKAVTLGLGSLHKRDAVRAFLSLPDVDKDLDWRQ